MDKTFQFYLKNADGRYYVVDNGVVSLVSVLPLSEPPNLGEIVASWRDVEVSIERAMENWGALIQYTLDSIAFINDGAIILKHIAFNLGMTSKVNLVVKKLNTFTMRYDNWTECEIEMASFNYDLVSANVTLFEGGLVGLLANREDVEYSIPIDNSGIQARLDGAYVRSELFWAVGSSNRNIDLVTNIGMNSQPIIGTSKTGFSMYIPNTFASSSVIAGQFVMPDSQNSSGQAGMGYRVVGNSFEPTLDTSARYMPTAVTTNDWRNVRISGVFDFTYHCLVSSPNGATVSIWILCVNPDNRNQQFALKVGVRGVITDSSSTWRTYSLQYNALIPYIPSGWLVYQVATWEMESIPSRPSVGSVFQIWSDKSNLYINFEAKVAPTNAIGYRYIDFLHKFVAKLTDNKYTLQSNFLSSQMTSQQRIDNYGSKPRNIFITSGTGLRRLPNPSINTTWKAILQDLFSQFNIIPSYVGNVIRLEPMNDTFSNQVIFDANSINNLEISFLSEKVFNSIKVGQTVSNNNNIVGLNEFNTTVNFLVNDNTNTKGELNLVSTFRRDVYGIESARAETIDNDKIDTKFDKDVWLVEIEDTPTGGSYRPYRVNTNFITGVDDPQGIYNTTLSPKRALLRNMSYIRSMYDIGQLIFVSTDKNPSLVSNTRVPYSAVGRIAETSLENLGNGSFYGVNKPQLFKPYVFEFDCSSDYNLIELTSNNLNGLVQFEYNGVVLKGWILNIGCKPSTRDSYRFRLLSHPSNNLTLL